MIEFEWDMSGLVGMQEAFAQAGEILQGDLEDATAEATDLLYLPVSAYGERPAYPINWDSDAQRKAFFATDGFGRGIPTERTGELASSWQESVTATPGTIIGKVYTNLQYALFVQGGGGQTSYSRFITNTAGRFAQSSIFVGFWPTVGELWDEKYPEIKDLFVKAIKATTSSIVQLIQRD